MFVFYTLSLEGNFSPSYSNLLYCCNRKETFNFKDYFFRTKVNTIKWCIWFIALTNLLFYYFVLVKCPIVFVHMCYLVNYLSTYFLIIENQPFAAQKPLIQFTLLPHILITQNLKTHLENTSSSHADKIKRLINIRLFGYWLVKMFTCLFKSSIKHIYLNNYIFMFYFLFI